MSELTEATPRKVVTLGGDYSDELSSRGRAFGLSGAGQAIVPDERVGSGEQSRVDTRFHRQLLYGYSTLLVLCILGCKLTAIHAAIGGRVAAMVAIVAMLAPLPLYWREKGRTALLESTLVIPWELLLALMLPFVVLIAARLNLPLRDALFGRFDDALGVSVPAIMTWADRHWLGNLISSSYPLLTPLLGVAGLVPAFVGQVQRAREFLWANLVAFAIGVPAFGFLPAVGPWYYYHLEPNSAQAYCWNQFQLLRLQGPYLYHEQGAGVICFPSFHVIWAILCAAALWDFRRLRIPVALLSATIIASTLTTGWHYFSDVLGGTLVAFVAIGVAKSRANQRGGEGPHGSDW